MRRRLREFFHNSKHNRFAERRRQLFEYMSPTLQGEVAWQINHRWLDKVRFLSGTQRPFLVEVACNLHSIVFAPADLCPPGFLYIVHAGVALRCGQFLHKGRVWGEDMILQSVHLRVHHAARAMGYLTCFNMNRIELMSIASKYPMTVKRLRRYAVFLALRREVCLRARIKRAAEEAEEKERSAGQARLKRAPTTTFSAYTDEDTGTVGSAKSFDGMLWKATNTPLEHVGSPWIGASASRSLQLTAITSVSEMVTSNVDTIKTVTLALA